MNQAKAHSDELEEVAKKQAATAKSEMDDEVAKEKLVQDELATVRKELSDVKKSQEVTRCAICNM